MIFLRGLILHEQSRIDFSLILNSTEHCTLHKTFFYFILFFILTLNMRVSPIYNYVFYHFHLKFYQNVNYQSITQSQTVSGFSGATNFSYSTNSRDENKISKFHFVSIFLIKYTYTYVYYMVVPLNKCWAFFFTN